MNQLALDFTQRARAADPETSHQAAKRVIDFASGHYALILKALEEHPYGGTIYEVSSWTGLTHVQVARRAAELHDERLIAPLDDVTRRSPSGRACRVWVLA